MHGGLNGSGSGNRRNFPSRVDMYRRVPKDLTEATTLGAFMSVCALVMIGVLFMAESMAYLNAGFMTEIGLDENMDQKLELHFNITLLDLECDLLSVDVWDMLGTNLQNVTKNVEKWQTDAFGNRKLFSGRNRKIRELAHDDHGDTTLEDLHQDGVHAIPLQKANFQDYLKENEVVFVDFFAPWCIWCQRLLPTWEKLAEHVQEQRMPVHIVSVDCVQEADLCREQKILAFPTLRVYEHGVPQVPDYKQDRTVEALSNFLTRKLELNSKFKDWEKTQSQAEVESFRKLKNNPELANPGCQVSGNLLVNRVPGILHVHASSVNHNINPAMTNLTHIVNHLSFGPSNSLSRSQYYYAANYPATYSDSPLDGQTYPTSSYHQAYHHAIKVVSTNFYDKSFSIYQFLEQSQLVYFKETDVPQAVFSYDLSPMSIIVKQESRHWYDYLTHLFAIIGGTFTSLGLIDATLYKVFKPKKL